jgi:hypothetical protein
VLHKDLQTTASFKERKNDNGKVLPSQQVSQECLTEARRPYSKNSTTNTTETVFRRRRRRRKLAESKREYFRDVVG